MTWKCIHCGRGLAEGLSLHRQNPKGEVPAIWACDEHNKLPTDPLVQEIVDIVQGQK